MISRLAVRSLRSTTMCCSTRCYSTPKRHLQSIDDILKEVVKDSSKDEMEVLKQRAQTAPHTHNRTNYKPKSGQSKDYPDQRRDRNLSKSSRNPPLNNRGNNHHSNTSKPKKFSPKSKQSMNPLNLLTETGYDPESFKWTESQSTLENEYITAKIKEVHGVNPSFKIIYYSDEGVKQDKLRNLIRSLDSTELFDVVNVQKIDNIDYPFLRITNKEATLKNYNEKLAEEKTKLFGRTKEKRRESGIKYLKVSWNISFSDLENQKTNEIVSLLKKDQKVVIIVDAKENLNKQVSQLLEDSKPSVENKLNELEALRREKILNYIKELDVGNIDITGKITQKCIITITPKGKNGPSSEEKKARLNEKKSERQMKQKQREEEKRAKAAAKAQEFSEIVSKL